MITSNRGCYTHICADDKMAMIFYISSIKIELFEFILIDSRRIKLHLFCSPFYQNFQNKSNMLSSLAGVGSLLMAGIRLWSSSPASTFNRSSETATFRSTTISPIAFSSTCTNDADEDVDDAIASPSSETPHRDRIRRHNYCRFARRRNHFRHDFLFRFLPIRIQSEKDESSGPA